jgi:hypothetical protein
MKKIILFSLFIFSSTFVFSQNKVVKFKNPSFEGIPQTGVLPEDWENFGPQSESPPDTQPESFGCTKKAADGVTYIGMAVRDNDTKEGIYQQFDKILKANVMYKFDMKLAKSEQYLSKSPATGNSINYDQGCILKIWIGNSETNADMLIYTSSVINHTEWKKHEAIFTPNADCDYIIFGLDFVDKNKPYCGNMLIDDLSDIVPIKK